MLLGSSLVGGLVVRIPGFHCRGLGSIPYHGTEILQAVHHGKKKKKKKLLKSTMTAVGLLAQLVRKI